jgi:hypothetical protein
MIMGSAVGVSCPQTRSERAGGRELTDGEAVHIPEMFVRMMSPLLPASRDHADAWASRWVRRLTPWEALGRLIRVLEAFHRLSAGEPAEGGAAHRLAREDEWLRQHAGWCCLLADGFRAHLAERGRPLPEVGFRGQPTGAEDAAVEKALAELWRRDTTHRHGVATPASDSLRAVFESPIGEVLRDLYDWSVAPRRARL